MKENRIRITGRMIGGDCIDYALHGGLSKPNRGAASVQLSEDDFGLSLDEFDSRILLPLLASMEGEPEFCLDVRYAGWKEQWFGEQDGIRILVQIGESGLLRINFERGVCV